MNNGIGNVLAIAYITAVVCRLPASLNSSFFLYITRRLPANKLVSPAEEGSVQQAPIAIYRQIQADREKILKKQKENET